MVYLFAIFIPKLEPAYEQQNQIIKADKKEIVRLLSHNIKHNTDSTKLIGEIQNMLDKKIEFVKAIATFYREDFTIIGTDISNITPSTILPKMNGSFKMNLDNGVIDELKFYNITITWQYPVEEDAKVFQFSAPVSEVEKKEEKEKQDEENE